MSKVTKISNLKFHSFFSPIVYACSVPMEGSENLKNKQTKTLVVLMCVGKILQLEPKSHCLRSVYLCILSLSSHKCTRLYARFQVEKYAIARKWPITNWGHWHLNKQHQYNTALCFMRKNRERLSGWDRHVFTEMTFSFGH